MTVVNTRRSAVAGCLAGLMLCGCCIVTSSSQALGDTTGSNDSIVRAAVENFGQCFREYAYQDSSESPSEISSEDEAHSDNEICGMPSISAHDFVNALNRNYGKINGCALSAESSLTSNGLTMQLNIKDGTKTVGRGLLYDDSGKGIYLSMSAMEDSLFNVTIFFDEYSSKRSEYIANTMMAVIMTADPTLSTAEVESLAVDWIDSLENVSRSEAISRVSKNGITYTLASWDNDDVWAVDVQVE